MKHIVAAFLFIVTWQEYALQCVTADKKNPMLVKVCTDEWTVETVDKSIKLKTQEDVELFAGKEVWVPTSAGNLSVNLPPHKEWQNGLLIGPNAFNIKVKEIEPDGDVKP